MAMAKYLFQHALGIDKVSRINMVKNGVENYIDTSWKIKAKLSISFKLQ